MVKVKSASDAAKKWTTRAAAASGDYVQGAQNAGGDWAQAAGAAGQNYQAAISAGDIQARYKAGISAAGPEKYNRGVAQKGGARYAQGVQVGQGEYARAAEQNQSVISSVQLPARQPKGNAANYQRVSAVGDALRKAKMARVGAGK